MTQQEVANMVYTGLKNQGWRQAMNENSHCVYRAPNGFKCAAGHVFTDEEVKNVSVIASAHTVIRDKRLEAKYSVDVEDFLLELQSIHDCSSRPHEMQSRIISCIKNAGLTIPE